MSGELCEEVAQQCQQMHDFGEDLRLGIPLFVKIMQSHRVELNTFALKEYCLSLGGGTSKVPPLLGEQTQERLRAWHARLVQYAIHLVADSM
eukprot:3546513-Alexandrium_andersonii.AAC.1